MTTSSNLESKCICLMIPNTFGIPEISGTCSFPAPLISPDCTLMYFTHAEYMMTFKTWKMAKFSSVFLYLLKGSCTLA